MTNLALKTPPNGKIGPNAVIQLGHAVTDRLGQAEAVRVFSHAGVPDMLETPPEDMTDERVPVALYQALWHVHPKEAPTLAHDAGVRTADYVIANRIPGFVKGILRFVPQRLAQRLLLKAIEKNAWTFVGSGHCETTPGSPAMITVKDNPLVMPDCVWHSAVFTQLFDQLVARGTEVRHVCGKGDAGLCKFEVTLPDALDGEKDDNGPKTKRLRNQSRPTVHELPDSAAFFTGHWA
ncbi:MAG: bacteriochlorophyll 4-vinyl reductase [Pseudomonadota bacterium]